MEFSSRRPGSGLRRHASSASSITPETGLGYRVLLAIWLALCILSYAHYRVLSGAQENAAIGLLRFTTCYYLWVPLTPVLFRLERRFPLTKPFSAAHAMFFALLGAPLCWLTSLAALNSLPLLHVFLARWTAPAAFTLHIRATEAELQAALYIATLGVSAFVRYLAEMRRKDLHVAQLAVEKAELEGALRQAELETLRMRLNPHFLFNCLQNISSLAGEDPKKASTMLAKLGDLLRVALSSNYQTEVALRDEIALTRAYLSIEQVRFGGRLSVLFALDPRTEGVPVPSLLLQPLVENALKHGLSGQRDQGLISIGSELGARALVLTVRDNGQGLQETSEEQVKRGFGIGLSATRERLERLYGHEQSLTLHALPEGGTEVRLSLPAPRAAVSVDATLGFTATTTPVTAAPHR